MIIILLALLIALVWSGIYVFAICNDGLGDFFVAWLASSLGALLLSCFLCYIIGLFFDEHYVAQETKQLAAVANSYGSSGSFFIGCGSIDQTQYYFYMEKTAEGYKPQRLEVEDNIIIKESAKESPKLIKSIYEFNKEWAYLIAMPHGDDKYTFIIPKGSIKNNFIMQ
jgi:hypothetical protein